jgi:hypothetical protein
MNPNRQAALFALELEKPAALRGEAAQALSTHRLQRLRAADLG